MGVTLNIPLATLATLLALYSRADLPPIDVSGSVYKALRYVRELNKYHELAQQGKDRSTSFRTGNVSVSPIGTAIQLTSENVPIIEGTPLVLLAKPGNSGVIYFGNSKEGCENTSKRFNGLDAGLAHSFYSISDIRDIWIDASVDGDGASWYVEQ